MFLFAAFQVHLSEIMLKIYENRNFQWSTRRKRLLLPFLGRYSLEGDIYLLFAKRRVFALKCMGSMNLQFDF